MCAERTSWERNGFEISAFPRCPCPFSSSRLSWPRPKKPLSRAVWLASPAVGSRSSRPGRERRPEARAQSCASTILIMAERRVAVTGIGMMCALGTNREDVWSGMVEGRCGIGELSLFDPEGYRSRLVAEIPDYHPERYFTPLEQRRRSRSDQVALLAAEEAFEDSGVLDDELDRSRVGVFSARARATCSGTRSILPTSSPAVSTTPNRPTCSITSRAHPRMRSPSASIYKA